MDFLSDASVDLITVGTALHWFDVERFCAECSRVLRPGGVLVAYSYGVGEFVLVGTDQANGKECMVGVSNSSIGLIDLYTGMNRFSEWKQTSSIL